MLDNNRTDDVDAGKEDSSEKKVLFKVIKVPFILP